MAKAAGHTAECMVTSIIDLREDSSIGDYLIASVGVGGGYGDSGYGGNNTVVVFPQAIPQVATGSVNPSPCNWKQQEFKVPSSAGGTAPVQVVSCH